VYAKVLLVVILVTATVGLHFLELGIRTPLEDAAPTAAPFGAGVPEESLGGAIEPKPSLDDVSDPVNELMQLLDETRETLTSLSVESDPETRARLQQKLDDLEIRRMNLYMRGADRP
jgi:hypothetical protein